jgi:hypothetical protein
VNENVISHGICGGFPAVVLCNALVGATVLPTLGARIVSLRSLRTSREWLWRAADGRGLFSSSAGNVFESGPLAGMDECLPTIAPCVDAGRKLPDHGEAWTSSWSTEVNDGGITNQLNLDCLPLRLRRRLTLAGNTLRLNYELTNLGSSATGLFGPASAPGETIPRSLRQRRRIRI